VLVPHPFGSLDAGSVRDEAGKVVEEIIEALTSHPKG
jgi:hypothetical protein